MTGLLFYSRLEKEKTSLQERSLHFETNLDSIARSC